MTAPSDTAAPRTPAIVIHPVVETQLGRDPQLRLAEAKGLAEALDLDVREALIAPVREVRPAAFFGSGRVAALGDDIKEHSADVAVIDAAVTPAQQRNLERAWGVKVLDRTGLILEIFGLRARTKEGRLQVELARLAYEKSRLVRTWTHLERQRGGRGFLAGPGESQIEADRRIITDRIARLRRDLADVRRTRGLHRAQRKKAPFPLIALVGYTNAGKSSLFNRLTQADVLAKDMPFATLDPTLRGLKLPSGVKAMFADTVGFISDLPHDLVEAFQATLEEVREADLLLHVRDVAHPETDGQRADVEAILDGLGAGEDGGQRVMEVWNKADLLDAEDREIAALRARRRAADEAFGYGPVLVSAKTGDGVDALLTAVDSAVIEGAAVYQFVLPASAGRALAWLHEHGDVLEERAGEDGCLTVAARLSAMAHGRFARMFAEVEQRDPVGRAAQ